MNEIINLYNNIILELKKGIKEINTNIICRVEVNGNSSSGNARYNYKDSSKAYNDNHLQFSERRKKWGNIFNITVELKEKYKRLALPQWNMIVIRVEENGSFDVDHYYYDDTLLVRDKQVYGCQEFYEYEYLGKGLKGIVDDYKIEMYKNGEIPVFTNKFTLKEILEGKKFEDFWHPEHIGIDLTDEKVTIDEINEKVELLRKSKNKFFGIYLGDNAIHYADFERDDNSVYDMNRQSSKNTKLSLNMNGFNGKIKYIMKKVMEGNLDKGVLITSQVAEEDVAFRIYKGERLDSYVAGKVGMTQSIIKVVITEEDYEEIFSNEDKDIVIKGDGMEVIIAL